MASTPLASTLNGGVMNSALKGGFRGRPASAEDGGRMGAGRMMDQNAQMNSQLMMMTNNTNLMGSMASMATPKVVSLKGM